MNESLEMTDRECLIAIYYFLKEEDFYSDYLCCTSGPISPEFAAGVKIGKDSCKSSLLIQIEEICPFLKRLTCEEILAMPRKWITQKEAHERYVQTALEISKRGKKKK